MKRRYARVGLNEINRVSDHFLDSGVNFLNTHSLLYSKFGAMQ